MSTHLAIIKTKTPFIIQFGLWLAIWIHVLLGVAKLFFVFPLASSESKRNHIQRWSKRLLEIFGIKLIISNPNILPDHSYLLSSNHISWMDIHAINAFKPIRFVAKSEVANWPIFGWMAKQLGTVFIRRDSSRHAHFVVGEMSEVLKSESICIFPEGTSTNGESVRPFKPNLFEAAVMAEVPVYTLAIRYISCDTGLRSDTPAFVGEMGLLESMSRILKDRHLGVELTFFPPAGSMPEMPSDRKWLALHSYEQITVYLTPKN
ncbi:1-acyl-sn-glycerol-3-phosphate acyltransferase [Polynucleobacter wuianus]|uniref:lysophospholipid acyltransferase family protein n=1 Tax=Polynucleobacter wuianus TaxID=1743168 RepID=UPI001C0D9C59|nr:lysophospholipid acyltransferase family protein [Polynucleobacter wuianus]MBU3609293.1 1-acyl-sn-glycerol-3-phosphate acyltransferase [Polynucleobacter wuianus]